MADEKIIIFSLVFPLVICEKLTNSEVFYVKENCGHHYLAGKSKHKSNGGRELKENEYPWLVTVIKEDAVCNGVLISYRHLLTAARCLVKSSDSEKPAWECKEEGLGKKRQLISPVSKLTVSVSSKCLEFSSCEGERLKVQQVYIPDDFDECDDENDLAMVELEYSVSPKVRAPICIPSRPLNISRNLITVGTGSKAQSGENSATKGKQVIDLFFIRALHKFILTTSKPGIAVCASDMGSPVFQNDTAGVHTLVGILSRGYTCAENDNTSPDEPEKWNPCTHALNGATDVSTDIRKNLEWICEMSGICPGTYAVDEDMVEDVCFEAATPYVAEPEWLNVSTPQPEIIIRSLRSASDVVSVRAFAIVLLVLVHELMLLFCLC